MLLKNVSGAGVTKPTGLPFLLAASMAKEHAVFPPAFPPEAQLKFTLKRELFCISSLASVASLFYANTLFKKQRVGRVSGFRGQEQGVLLFLQRAILNLDRVLGRPEQLEATDCLFCPSPGASFPGGLPKLTHHPIVQRTEEEGGREVRFINTTLCPIAF